MHRLLIVLIAVFCSLLPPQARSAETLHVAHPFAEPEFARDPAACPGEEGGGLVGYVGTERVCADIMAGNLRGSLLLSALLWTVAILVVGFLWFRAAEERYARD